jgi:hypothetical protein
VLTSAVLKDKNGKVLFTTTKGKSCAINSVCAINVNQKLITKDNTFFFYDSNNKLVSAYSFFNLTKTPASMDVQADLASLGIYVFDKIQRNSPNITFDNLATSFYNVKDQRAPFSALGDYYLDFLGSNTDDTSTIKELAKQINSNEPLLINPKSTRVTSQGKPVVLKSNKSNAAPKGVQSAENAQETSPFCSKEFKSSMDLLSFVPIPGMDLLIKGATTTADFACGPQDDYTGNFAEINAKLGEIAQSLAKMNNLFVDFMDETRAKDVGLYIDGNLKTNTNQIDTDLGYYFGLLKVKGGDGKVHSSLEALAASYGGVDQALLKSNDFKDKTTLLANKSSEIITNYKNMVSGSEAALGFLNSRCKTSSMMPKDVIATRLECNYRILDIYTKLSVSAEAVQRVFADYQKTFGAKKPASMLDLDASVIKNINQQIDLFKPEKAFFDPLGGLDTALVNNIKAIPACNVKNEDKKDITQITAWYDGTGVLQDGKGKKVKPYITTRCFGNSEGGVLKDQITANYNYQDPNDAKIVDTEVVNVLGVLVPKRFFKDHNSDNFAHTSWIKQSNPQVYASGDSSSISGKYFVNLKTAINNQNSGYTNTVSPANNSMFADTKLVKVSRNNTQYDRNLSMPQFPSSIAGALELKTSFQLADYWGSSSSTSGYSNNFYTYMRTLDENNIGYVWAIKNDMYREWQPSNDMFYFRTSLLCMTNDCKVNSTASSLVFDKGVSSDADTTIAFTGDEHLNTNSDNQVVDKWYDNTKLYLNGKTGF